MKRNQLGGSEIKVSQICLGTMTFGNPVEKSDAIKLVHWCGKGGVKVVLLHIWGNINQFEII